MVRYVSKFSGSANNTILAPDIAEIENMLNVEKKLGEIVAK